MNYIGNRVRSFRKALGLSLKQVADRIGCNPSYLSMVENDKLDPSASRLKEIADALGMTLIQILSDEDAAGVIFHVRDRQHVSVPGSKMMIDILVRQTPDKKMDARLVTVESKGGSVGGYSHEGEEFGYILEGVLELKVEEVVYNLSKGDTFYFKSTKKHSFSNTSDTDTQVLWVNHPPTY